MSSKQQTVTKEHIVKVIKHLSTSKSRITDLVQDLSNGRIFVISTFPKSKTEAAAKITVEDYYRKYGTITHPCLAPMHGNYIPNFEDQNIVKFAMPYYINSSLANIISLESSGKHPFEWNSTKKSMVAFGMAVAIKALHSEELNMQRSQKRKQVFILSFGHQLNTC